MTVYVVATTEPNWLLFAFCQAVWPISAIYSYYMTYLKVWPLKIPIGLSAGNKMINVTKSADFIKDVHSQQNNIKKQCQLDGPAYNSVRLDKAAPSQGNLLVCSVWARTRSLPCAQNAGGWSQLTSTESVLKLLNSLKTRQNALVNNLKGADIPKGYSI